MFTTPNYAVTNVDDALDNLENKLYNLQNTIYLLEELSPSPLATTAIDELIDVRNRLIEVTTAFDKTKKRTKLVRTTKILRKK